MDIASVEGGAPAADPSSLADSAASEDTRAFLADAVAQAKVAATRPVSEFESKAGEYRAVFLPGGHGTAIDFAPRCVSPVCALGGTPQRVCRPPFVVFTAACGVCGCPSAGLKAVVEGVYANGGVVAAVCHGPCGLVTPLDTATGRPLVAGKRVTGFSNAEEAAVGLLDKVPFALEDKLKESGGVYECGGLWAPHVVVDGRLVTGQNPASSKAAGDAVVALLAASA